MFTYTTPIRFDIERLKAAVAEIQADPEATKTAKNNSAKLLERIVGNDLFAGISPFFTDHMTGTSKGNTARVYYSPSYTQAPRKVRKGVVPVREGNKFIYLDITAAEFVMNSYLIGDQRIVEANLRGEDVYLAYKDIFPAGTPRDFIKNSLIATMYGATYFTVQKMVGCTEREAKGVIRLIDEAIPLRVKFAARVEELAQRTRSYWSGTGFSFDQPVKISDVPFGEPVNLRRALSIATQSALGIWMQGLLLTLRERLPQDTTLIQVFDSVLFEVPEIESFDNIREELKLYVSPFNFKIGEGPTFYEAQISAK